MTKPRTGTIYALSDPRDDSIRYIGKTTQQLLNRLSGHLAQPTNPAMRVWINALGAQGLVPHISTVKTTSLDKLGDEEKRQILLHAKAGHRLLNSPYYQRNLGDLFAPVVEAVVPAEPEERAAKGDAFAHQVFGPIVAARAAGRMSKRQAATRVVWRAPVVGAVCVLSAVTGRRAFRPVFLGSLAAFYLWTIGFGRIVKDFLFPHLPVAELVQFWHGYLAAPAKTLGLHALAFIFLAGVAAYLSVAEAAGLNQPKAKPAAGRRAAGAPSPLIADLTSEEVAAQAAAALDSAIASQQSPARQ